MPADPGRGATKASPKGERRLALATFKRDAIITAARQVFAAQGLEGATIRAIAEAAGIAPGTVYLQFDSKEAIYAEMLTASLADLLKSLREAVAPAMPPAERLLAGALGFYRFYQHRPEDLHLGLYLAQGLKPTGLSPALDRMLNGRLIQCFALLGEAIQASGLNDPEQVRRETVDLVGSICGTLLLQATGRLRMLGDDGEAVIQRQVGHLVERLHAPR
ncbi:MAG: TetR/AcrR family transcriptional regulator [Ferrovibrio sp.]|nr:TetR/AcrR family transcriptional regulator [Ferrovibrio sp.]